MHSYVFNEQDVAGPGSGRGKTPMEQLSGSRRQGKACVTARPADVMGSFDRRLCAGGERDKLRWVMGGHKGMARSWADALAWSEFGAYAWRGMECSAAQNTHI